ncbi:MAG: tRNA (guanosine(37)-N1)-methyltransferase TrmD [Bacteroidia bacterium]|nr:tRNA (guanosine(37)-N1)-methyltransferase TrmD [Bacteroidia bacterium]|tara:strand:+ start:1231 stop:1911 length:681 start_codon:yes stop_codon:yes gene_type:complete
MAYRIDIISVQPKLMESPLNHSIVQRAKDKGIIEIVLHDLKDYGLGKYRQVDDTVYGGGAGMVIRCEPVFDCIEKLQSERAYDEIIYMCPDGEVYNQATANQLSLKKNIIILCGHYKGIDQRIRDHLITKEISIGDYVLSGGELAAVILADSICRLIPGVISDEESALTDSFQDDMLAPPVYTRPAEYRGMKVPEVLQSGHFAKIAEWRDAEALKITKDRRPDLLE